MRHANFDSFIEVVGFQLEKVHTGLIAWMMDTRNPHIPSEPRRQFLQEIIGVDHPIPNDYRVDPYLEQKLGKSFCDLMLSIRNTDNTFKHDIVIEAKIDSIAYPEQLERMETGYQARGGWGETPHFRLLVLGASDCTYQHFLEERNPNWKVMDRSYCLRHFQELRSSHGFVEQWIAALEEEEERKQKVVEWSAVFGDDVDEALREHGFRGRWHWYFYWYHQLRIQLESTLAGSQWAIYSGSNNPVLNLKTGWLDLGTGQNCEHNPEGYPNASQSLPDASVGKVEAYWEFNDSKLMLKLGYKNVAPETVETWRERLRNNMKCQELAMHNAKRGKIKQEANKWFSLTVGRWDFDFCKDSPQAVAEKTAQVIPEMSEVIRGMVTQQGQDVTQSNE